MTYQPNFNDSRNLARAKKALNFVQLYVKSNEVSPIASTQLYQYFGNTSRPLGRWLLEHLLINRDPYFNHQTGQCKKYSANPNGIQHVKELAGLVKVQPEMPHELVEQIRTGEFKYEEKSDRLFNPVQFIPKRFRNQILNNHGYRYHYDIGAAAPTMLLQRARQLDPKLVVAHLDHYVKNRGLVRNEIAKKCEISENQVKAVINGILQGGVLSTWTSNKIFMELNYNYDAVIRLNHCDQMIKLKDDISRMWKALRSEFSVRYSQTTSGKQRLCKITPKEKSALYRQFENEIGEVIRKRLKKEKTKFLWIHDGWCCDKVIDPNSIVSEVRQLTGFVIELDWAIYEDN